MWNRIAPVVAARAAPTGSRALTTRRLKVPAYARMDLSRHYELGRLYPTLCGLSLRLNAGNLLGKGSLSCCASGRLHRCYGEQGSLSATLRYEF